MRRHAVGRVIALVLVGVVGSGCGYSDVRARCPGCVVLDRNAAPAPLPAGTRTAVILVEGLLGFGWEWDGAVAMLAARPATATRVFHWPPSASLGRSARELASALNALLRTAPDGARDFVVFGHSAGGLVAAFAAAQLTVPAGRRVHIASVGAPYAGMHVRPSSDGEDMLWSPLALSIGGTFRRYPTPAPRVSCESFVTAWPGDPVMKPRFGHDPGDPRVGPPGPRHLLPPGSDHNQVLTAIVFDVLNRLTSNGSSTTFRAHP